METQFSQALKWLPNVIALIAACYGIAFQQSILQSSRPLLPTNLETKSGLRAERCFVGRSLRRVPSRPKPA